MSDCTPEIWTLKEIKDSLDKECKGKRKIVIPMFQRGKRWDKKKQTTFIDSLRKKYPIGTLLFYRTIEGEQEVYTLIDGLQRGTSIRDYLSNPFKYFRLNEFSERTINSIYDLILANGNIEQQKALIDDIILRYVQKLGSYDDFELSELYTNLLDEFPNLNNKLPQFVDALKPEVKKLKDDYNSLCQLSIPAIVYTGDENTLPEIFERINSQGVALTEYEIYAASWPRVEFSITNESIVEYVLKKYDTLNDSEYSLKDYDREKKRKNQTVNSFEYVFGLSKWISKKYSSLNFYDNLKDDETNPLAFQLLNGCFNSAHSSIKEVHKIITRFQSNICILENALIDSINFVNKCIEPVLRFKGNNRTESGKNYHSQYQIMSLISFVFRKKYDIADNNLKIRDNWRDTKAKLINNIMKYYIYDILVNYWGEGGTSKIHTANSENRYFNELSAVQFSTAYDSYIESFSNRHEEKKISPPSKCDYILLNTIYLNSFSAMDQLSIDKFDVEHIATKDQMRHLIKKTQGNGLPISHFANLCYLPEFENRVKKAFNFYQDKSYLTTSRFTLENIEEKFSFTKAEDLEFMDLPYEKGDFDALKTYYFEFLRARNKIIKQKFLSSLGFNISEGDNIEPEEVREDLLFDDKYFRITKIGRMVKEVIKYLIDNKELSETDILNLCDKDYSNQIGTYLPILQKNFELTFDKTGNQRYYIDPVEVNGGVYYLCREWKENRRDDFVKWAKDKLKNIL